MKKILFYIMISLIFPFYINAQSISSVIFGKVIDKETGEPLTGVNVFIAGTNIGDVTESNGEYEIENVPPGIYEIKFRMIGYNEYSTKVQILSGLKRSMDVSLMPTAIEFEDVTVEADRTFQDREDTKVSLRFMKPKDAKKLPGGAEDVFRSLHSLPGVLSRSEFDSRLYIRGGRPDQNLTLMDGISVYDPYRIFGLVSMFNPETVSSIKLLAGGFPAKYGDRLSAVIEIENRSGNNKKYFSGNVNANITNANFIFEGRLPENAGSWVISSRRTYYDIVLSQISDIGTFPNFFDFQTKLNFVLDNKNTVDVIGIFSNESTDVNAKSQEESDSLAFLDRQKSIIFGIALKHFYTNNFYSKTIISYYKHQTTRKFDAKVTEKGFIFNANMGLYTLENSLKHDFVYKSEKYSHSIETGFQISKLDGENEWEFYTDNPAVTARMPENLRKYSDRAPSTFKSGIYLQDDWKILEPLVIEIGGRYDYSSLVSLGVLSPRFAMSYQLNILTTLRGAFGHYYQFPSYETLQSEGFRIDLRNIKSLGIVPEKSIHYLLGVERKLTEILTFRVEAYTKELSELLVSQSRDTTYLVVDRTSGQAIAKKVDVDYLTFQPENSASGYSRGIEILLEKRSSPDSKFSGWLSYTFAITKATWEWGRSSKKGEFYLRYDQRHTIDIVLDYKLFKWLDVGFKWNYGSGFPYTPINGAFEVIEDRGVDSDNDGVYEIPPNEQFDTEDKNGNGKLDAGEDLNNNGELDSERTVFVADRSKSSHNSARLPAYHRLDMRVSHERKMWNAHWTFYIDIVNVYNRKNVQGYEYNDDYTEKQPRYGIPFVPTAGISVRF
jgi:hypothetical protein